MREHESTTIRCSRCVTPASYPGISLDAHGVCNFCNGYKRIYGDWQRMKEHRRHMFDKILAKARRKNRQYDVMVPFSGGKDSTYTLYLMTRVYGMKTLAYTFHNGFLTEAAKRNIDNAIKACGADHYLFRTNPQKTMSLYRHFFEHSGLVCPICMRGMALGRIALCRQYKIPLILRGTSLRTEEWVTSEIFQNGSLHFFRNVLRKHPVDFNVSEFMLDRNFCEKISLAIHLLSGKRLALGVMDMQAPDYLEWDYAVIYKTIQEECGWQKLPDRDEHVDCEIEPVISYIRKTKVPSLTPNTLRYSAMVRAGQMQRHEAMKLVEEEMAEAEGFPDETRFLLAKLGISLEEFHLWADSSFRHMRFQKEPLMLRLFNFVRGTTSKETARA